MHFPQSSGRPASASSAGRKPLVSTALTSMLVILSIVAFCSISGCSEEPEPRGTLFDRAEKHYQRGDYDAALREYQAFLQQYPTSPLADTAQTRIRSINLEIETALSSDHSFTPTYTGGEKDAREISGSEQRESQTTLPENIDESSTPSVEETPSGATSR